jgi:phage replication O-like protein O
MPQVEDGYTKIANELLDALIKIRIPGEARQIFDAILRKTYGFNKKSDQIALSQFMTITGLKKVAICKGIKKLLELNIITQKGNDIAKEYGINKHYSTWKPLPKKVTLPKKVINVTKKGNKSLPKKDTTKDNIQKTKDTAKKTRAEKINPWAVWVDVNREFGRPDPATIGPDLKAAKVVAENSLDRPDLENLFRLFLSDKDSFLSKQGYPLRLMPGRINKYIALVESLPAAFGSHEEELKIIEEIERGVK